MVTIFATVWMVIAATMIHQILTSENTLVLTALRFVEYYRRLPHLQPEDTWIFLTWRLFGSLPKGGAGGFACQDVTSSGRAFVAIDRALDQRSAGPRWLADSRIAATVSETIHIGETERLFYELRAWVIMPNHVHLLVLPKVPVPVITRWLKGSTARKANRLLDRTGQRFWQDESYDRWVRTGTEMERIVRYIERNPVSAGLVETIEAFRWSSARQAKPPAPPAPRM